MIDGRVEPEDFTTRLQRELNSSPQPCLVPFLKRSLPYLQQSLAIQELTIEGVRPPAISQVGKLPPAVSTAIINPPMSTAPTLQPPTPSLPSSLRLPQQPVQPRQLQQKPPSLPTQPLPQQQHSLSVGGGLRQQHVVVSSSAPTVAVSAISTGPSSSIMPPRPAITRPGTVMFLYNITTRTIIWHKSGALHDGCH